MYNFLCSFFFFFASLGNTKKLLSTLEMPLRLTPTIIRYVGTCTNFTLRYNLSWLLSYLKKTHITSFKAVQSKYKVIHCQVVQSIFPSYGVSKCTSSSNISLIIVFILRPSWLQAAWCRPMVTLMWPWTSTEWQHVLCLRAPLSGTTSACAFLAKRNM